MSGFNQQIGHSNAQQSAMLPLLVLGLGFILATDWLLPALSNFLLTFSFVACATLAFVWRAVLSPQRTPWVLLSMAHALWLLATAMDIPSNMVWHKFPWYISYDVLYLLFYTLFWCALTLFLARLHPSATLGQWRINAFLGVMVAAGLFAYLVVMPFTHNAFHYETWVPSFQFYMLMDFNLLLAALLMAIRIPTPLTRRLPLLPLLWLLSDTGELWYYHTGPLQSFLSTFNWAVIYLPAVVWLVLCPLVSVEQPSSSSSEQKYHIFPTVFVVATLPLFHLLGYGWPFLHRTLLEERTLFIGVWIVLGLIFLLYLKRRNDRLPFSSVTPSC